MVLLGDENLLFYINLTGELFYIVAHRMKSQAIRPDLQRRVFDELTLVICNQQMCTDLLNGTLRLIPNYSLTELKMMLTRIVHSSIMNINDYSMEKLFELTLIATKYQYSVCQNPKHILLIALNHVDSIRKYLCDPTALQAVKNLHGLLVDSYSTQVLGDEPGNVESESDKRMSNYRQAILSYLKDVNLKMTNLIKLGLQKPNGDFVLDSVTKSAAGVVITPGSLELNGVRGIKLGLSIYEIEVDADKKHDGKRQARSNGIGASDISKSNKHGQRKTEAIKNSIDGQQQALEAIQGLDLCGILLGCKLDETLSKGGSSGSKVIDSFHNLDTSPAAVHHHDKPNSTNGQVRLTTGEFSNVVHFDASGQNSTNSNRQIMSEIAKEFDLCDQPKGTNVTAHLFELVMGSSDSEDK